MKYWRYILLGGLFVAISAPAYAHASILIKPTNNLGLVGYWALNEGVGSTAADSSGNSNTGTLTNSPAWINGRSGTALGFNGASQYVDLGNGSSLQITSDITVSAWINPTTCGSGAYMPIIGKRQLFNAPAQGYELYLPNDDTCYISWYNGTEIKSSYAVPTNTWTLVTATVHAGVLTLYANGVVVYTATDATPASADGNAYIGAALLSDGVYFQGGIDDARIYNRALSLSEVAYLYTNGNTINTSSANLQNGSSLASGLVGLWTFDGADVTDKVYDRSGNSNNGYFVGGATTSAIAIGKMGQAFSPNTKYVVTPSLFNPQSTDFTLAAWIYVTSNAAADTIFSQENGSGTGRSWFLVDTTGQLTTALGNGGYLPRANSVLALNTWYHVVLVKTGTGSLTYYINGVSDGTDTRTVESATGNFRIGATKTGTQIFKGKIDDARVYNRALSATEIMQLYKQGGAKLNTSSANLQNGSSLASGLVGLWTFDGADVTDKVYDRSGNSNNGYFVGTATTSAATIGKMGQAFKFNGTTDYITFGNIASITALPVSISVWFKPLSFSGEAGEMIVQTNNPTASYYYCGIQLLYTSTTIQAQYGNCAGTTSATRKTFSATVSLKAGTWYHVVMVGTSLTDAKLYINGVLQSTSGSGSASSVVFNSQPAVVGLWSLYNLTDRYSNMAADDLRIYNRALSASEVTQLYTMGR